MNRAQEKVKAILLRVAGVVGTPFPPGTEITLTFAHADDCKLAQGLTDAQLRGEPVVTYTMADEMLMLAACTCDPDVDLRVVGGTPPSVN